MAELAAANGLGEDDLLQIGQELIVPGFQSTAGPGKVDEKPEAEPATEVIATDRASEPAAAPTADRVHQIEAGDTIFGIALRYGVDWQDILDLNGLADGDLLQPGDEIRLP